jgi:hypothetical protein
MRTRGCGKKSKRGCVCRQHDFFDADARLNHAREYGPNSQGGDGCCNYPTVSSSTHSFSLIEYSHNVLWSLAYCGIRRWLQSTRPIKGDRRE